MPQKTFAVNFETSGFRRASRKMNEVGNEANDAGSNLKSAGKVGAAAIAGIATAITGAVAGMGKLIQNTAEYARQVDQAAEQSGIARDRIQEIAFAAQQTSGASFDAVRDGMKELAIRSQEAANGTGEAKEAFDQLGISQQFLEESSPSEVFKRVRQELQGASKRMRIFAAETIFGGEAGEKLVETLGLSSEEMKRFSQRARESGKVLSKEQVQALESARQSWSALTSKATGFGRQIAANLAPVVTNTIIPAMRSMGQAVRNASRTVMSGGGGAFQSFLNMGRRVANGVLNIWNQFSAGLQKIWKEWGGFIVEQAKSTWQNVVSLFHGVAGVISGVWDTLVGVLTGNWSRAWQGIKQIVTSSALTIAQAVVGLVESVLNTTSKLAEYIPGVGDSISSGLDSARQSVASFRDRLAEANKEASGLQDAWEGFSGGDFGGGGAGGMFSTSSGPSTSTSSAPTVGTGQQSGQEGGSTSPLTSLPTLLKRGKKAMAQMKQKSSETATAIAGGFRQINSQIGQATANLLTGKNAAVNFGNAMVSALQSVIKKLVAMIAKLGVIKAIGAIAGIGTGGISTIGGALTAAIPGLAQGGIVTGPTLAMVGEGSESEAVMPLSKLNSVLNNGAAPGGTVASGGSAQVSGGKIEIPVEVVREANVEGNRRNQATGRVRN
jgi:hypothetical protein